MDRDRFLQSLDVLANVSRLDEAEMAEALVDRGFAIDEAYRLIAFVPSAFSRPVIESLGRVRFVRTASVLLEESGYLNVRFEDQPEFRVALDLARAHAISGCLPGELFNAIVSKSAEIDTVNQALNADAQLDGSTIAVTFLNPIVAIYAVRMSAWAEFLDRAADRFWKVKAMSRAGPATTNGL